jgi:DHA2 family multidrug resistance protein
MPSSSTSRSASADDLLTVGLSSSKMRLDELLGAPTGWASGMALGLGGLTVVLEEGNREQWFQSTLIWQLSGHGSGFILIGLGQFFARGR